MLRSRHELHGAGFLRVVPGPIRGRTAWSETRWRLLNVHAEVLHALGEIGVAFGGVQQRLVGFLEMRSTRHSRGYDVGLSFVSNATL
jgi:hypothetical protein